MNCEKTVIALGFFDGVHLGHGALLRRTAERAAALGAVAAAFTFDRPPKAVVTGANVQLINSVEDRIDLMGELYGVRQVIVAPFDRQMMTCPWQEFIRRLAAEHGACHLVAGHDYRFGHKNEGTPELLRRRCEELGLGCDVIPRVEIEGVTVSSTYIRRLLEQGEVERAALFLGHPHRLSQTVGHGRRLGRTIGAPTVNLAPPEGVLLPRRGVYVSRARLADGSVYPGVTNVGVRPTVSDGGAVSVETHMMGFAGELYGQRVTLEFLRRLRPERRFDSVEELRRQIRADTEAAQAYFSENSID